MCVTTRSVFDFVSTPLDSSLLDSESAGSALRCVSVPSYVSVPFFRNGNPLPVSSPAPQCHLTLAAAGSMRFRWNETNAVRDAFFRNLRVISEPPVSAPSASELSVPMPPVSAPSAAVPIELIHSRTVYALDGVRSDARCSGKYAGAASAVITNDGTVRSAICDSVCSGDGLISRNRQLLPIITVADCMPVYLYDPQTGCFGVLHSGWKGTGIAANALRLAAAAYGARAEDFLVVLGPHIHDCCYTVNAERAAYFAAEYTPECIEPGTAAAGSTAPDNAEYRLSLAQANIALLLRAGVNPANILHCTDCTCCDARFGSFRRQSAGLPAETPLEERVRRFTAMAAFIG